MFKATDFPITMIVNFWDNAAPTAPKSGLTVTGDIWDSRTGTLLWDNLSMPASANDAGAYVATITQAMYNALSAGNQAIFAASILVCTATPSVTTGLARTTERAWVAIGLGGVGNLDASINAVKGKTDNLPASPAAVGSAMTLTSAYDAAKTAVQVADLPVAPDNDGIAAIQEKTDQLVFSDGKVDANASIDGTGLALQETLLDVRTRVMTIEGITISQADPLIATELAYRQVQRDAWVSYPVTISPLDHVAGDTYRLVVRAMNAVSTPVINALIVPATETFPVEFAMPATVGKYYIGIERKRMDGETAQYTTLAWAVWESIDDPVHPEHWTE